MLEEDLKRIICLRPELIEEGFKVDQEEYPVRTDVTTYRCDLKGKDKSGQTVFVELKLSADKHVVYQISKYKTFIPEKGRFIVAAFNFDSETKKVLEALGFETKELKMAYTEELLEKEKDNPELYNRKSSIVKSQRFKQIISKSSLYTQEEQETIKLFMNALGQIIEDNAEMTLGFRLQGLDVRSQDKYRLLLRSDEFPSDRIVIYNRARKREEIHIMFVPDFSFNPGSTDKKRRFKTYVENRRKDIEQIFDLLFVDSGDNIMQEHLEITCQAWKGFSKVIVRGVERWNHPDFIEMVGRQIFEFIDSTVPIVREFYDSTK